MHRRAFLGSLAALALAEETRKLTADELKQLIDSKKQNYFFLDVREPKELAELGTVKGYVNIPLGQLESRLAEIPKNKIVVTICNRAARATRAAELLRSKGYKVLGACAMNEYREKHYPLLFPKAGE